MPPREIEDPEDTKPFNWDDRHRIPDPTVTKPDDWYVYVYPLCFFTI